jgi:peptide/nickel transport system permease protein
LAGAVAALLPSASTRLVPLRRLPAIVPGFWLALVALWLFASDVGRIPLLPGRGTYVGLTADPSGWLRSLLLGWIVLALAFVAGSPAGGQEDLAAGRSRWARAQGLRWTVAYRRRLRAAATRIAGVPASQLAAVFGGVVAIEVAFRIPGLGETAERGMRDGHRGQVAAVIVTALAALAIRELLRVLIAVRRGTER